MERLALLGRRLRRGGGRPPRTRPQGRWLDRVARLSVAAVSGGDGVADLRGDVVGGRRAGGGLAGGQAA